MNNQVGSAETNYYLKGYQQGRASMANHVLRDTIRSMGQKFIAIATYADAEHDPLLDPQVARQLIKELALEGVVMGAEAYCP